VAFARQTEVEVVELEVMSVKEVRKLAYVAIPHLLHQFNVCE